MEPTGCQGLRQRPGDMGSIPTQGTIPTNDPGTYPWGLLDHSFGLATCWRWGDRAMRQRAFLGVLVLVLSGLTLSVPSVAAASSTNAQKRTQTVKCTRTATGHKKVTKSEVTTCASSSLKVRHLCPKGSTTIFVGLHDRTYALRVGHTPERLPKQYGMGTITQVCGYSHSVPVPPTTTSTTAAPAPTTTTGPPPPPTTTVPPPPPTTAAAPSCTPLSDEGTCYEPGEYCRDSDHGASGVAGNGERITCEDNDGWRWEPA